MAEEARKVRTMNRSTAEALIKHYFQSWLQQDLSLFLSTLSPNSKVVECYGPIYCGLEELRQWFVNWHTGDGKGKVTHWDILHILYDETQEMAAVEWDFECVYEGKTGSFLGASLFHFDGAKIDRIQEYKMEKEQYRPYGEQIPGTVGLPGHRKPESETG
jgi:hypothetical protein